MQDYANAQTNFGGASGYQQPGYGGQPGPFVRPTPGSPPMLHYQFFLASIVVLVSGVLGAIDLLLHEVYAIFDLTACLYLVIFGLILFMLDNQLRIQGIVTTKKAIGRYCKFLTRLAGKGTFFIFLATHVYGTLMDNNISPLLGIIFGLYVFIIGLTGCVMSHMTSKRLEKARLAISRQFAREKIAGIFLHYATTPNAVGMQRSEFGQLVMHFAGETLLDNDLSAIFDALAAQVGSQFLTERDFTEWIVGSKVWV